MAQGGGSPQLTAAGGDGDRACPRHHLCRGGRDSGLVMTDSQYVTDWSGVYIGGKLGGAFSDLNWSQDLNVFTNGGAVSPNSPLDFSPSGIAGGIIGGANLQLGQWIFAFRSRSRAPSFPQRTRSQLISTGSPPWRGASATPGTA